MTRRRKSSAYDYLLLLVFDHEKALGPIGQVTLLRVAEAFDPATKKASLIAKLNRWKNEQGYLAWADADRLQITKAGQERRASLHDIVIKRDKQGSKIVSAFKQGLNLDIAFD